MRQIVTLTQKEADSFGSTGFVGIVEFERGPRGGEYRGKRTKVYNRLDDAIAALERLADQRQWRVQVKSHDVFEIDSQGREVNAEWIAKFGQPVRTLRSV